MLFIGIDNCDNGFYILGAVKKNPILKTTLKDVELAVSRWLTGSPDRGVVADDWITVKLKNRNNVLLLQLTMDYFKLL